LRGGVGQQGDHVNVLAGHATRRQAVFKAFHGGTDRAGHVPGPFGWGNGTPAVRVGASLPFPTNGSKTRPVCLHIGPWESAVTRDAPVRSKKRWNNSARRDQSRSRTRARKWRVGSTG